jgi:hypothetical protein
MIRRRLIRRLEQALDFGLVVLGLALVLAALGGCSSAEVRIPERVLVPVAVACVDQAAAAALEAACAGIRPDAEILELDDYRAIQALRADRGRAALCIPKLQAAIAACAKIPGGAPPPLGGVGH